MKYNDKIQVKDDRVCAPHYETTSGPFLEQLLWKMHFNFRINNTMMRLNSLNLDQLIYVECVEKHCEWIKYRVRPRRHIGKSNQRESDSFWLDSHKLRFYVSMLFTYEIHDLKTENFSKNK